MTKGCDGELGMDMNIEEVVSLVKDKPNGFVPSPDSGCASDSYGSDSSSDYNSSTDSD